MKGPATYRTDTNGIRNFVCHVSLQAGPSRRRSYPVAYLRVCENCNGLLPNRRIVVACFKTLKIVMAWNQKKPFSQLNTAVMPRTLCCVPVLAVAWSSWPPTAVFTFWVQGIVLSREGCSCARFNQSCYVAIPVLPPSYKQVRCNCILALFL
jgi:hypothetical protein